MRSTGSAPDLVSFEQREDRVVSVIRPHGGGPEEVVSSDYLVAADGAHSTVRDQLGIPMSGRGTFADCVTIYFKADVKPLMGGRNLSVVYVNHPRLTGFFRFSITGDSGFLAVFSTLEPDGTRDTHVGADIPVERCIELVRTALGGEPDLPVEIEGVQRWSAMAATAESFQRGRVFLAGDSAHVMPPTGGFGGNTGVADAHNLAWKLAFVSSGLAGSGLLSTYDAERRPIAALTVEQAYSRYVLRVDTTLPKDDLMPPLDDAAIELGAIYRSSAVWAEHDAEHRARAATRRSEGAFLDRRCPRSAHRAGWTGRPRLDAGRGRRRLRPVGRRRARDLASRGGGRREIPRRDGGGARRRPDRFLAGRAARMDRSRADLPRRGHRLEAQRARG